MIVSGGEKGPCRAGYYGELHVRILRDLGYDPEMIFFWPPLKTPLDFIKKVKRLKGSVSWRTVWHHLKTNWEKLKALDDIELGAHRVRPRELKRGEATRAMEKVSIKNIPEKNRRGFRALLRLIISPLIVILINLISPLYKMLIEIFWPLLHIEHTCGIMNIYT